MQTLEKLSRAIGVVSNAIELGKLASTKDGGSSVTAGPAGMQNPAKVMIEFHEREIKSIRGSIRQWQGIIEIRGAKVQQTDRELLNTFLRNGVKIPESEQKLVLPQKR